MTLPAIPTVTNAERRSRHVAAGTGPFSIGFPLYASGDLAVYLDGVEVVSGWSITRPGGAAVTYPLSDGRVEFAATVTGTLDIVGERPARSIATFQDGQTSERAQQTAYETTVAILREHDDKLNRAWLAAFGQAGGRFPTPANGSLLGWNGTTLDNFSALSLGAVNSYWTSLLALSTNSAVRGSLDVASVFTELNDVPASYSGQAGKYVAVNGGATALEFVSAPSFSALGPLTAYETRAAAIAATIDAGVKAILLTGYAATGDCPPHFYKRVGSEPSHLGKLSSNGGTVWWELEGDQGSVDYRWFGAKVDAVTDDAAAFSAALAYCAASTKNKILRFPAGTSLVSGGPYYNRGVYMEGQGSNNTIIRFTTDKATAGTKLWFDGSGGATGGGIKGMCFHAATGINGGVGIRLQGDATYQPDESYFEDVKVTITGTGKWDYPIYLYGNSRTSDPKGLRDVSMHKIFCGGAEAMGFYASCVIDFDVTGLGVFGGAVSLGTSIYITGSGSLYSNDVKLYAVNCQSTITVENTTGALLSGYFQNVAFTTGATKCVVQGIRNGTYSTVGANLDQTVT